MRRLISCDFYNFDSAERAMCLINHIDCNGIKMSLNHRDLYEAEHPDVNLIPVVQTIGSTVSPFPAVAMYSDLQENEDCETDTSDKCSLLVSFDDSRYANRIISTLRQNGAVKLREIKF